LPGTVSSEATSLVGRIIQKAQNLPRAIAGIDSAVGFVTVLDGGDFKSLAGVVEADAIVSDAEAKL
jgi:hypothetical protein